MSRASFGAKLFVLAAALALGLWFWHAPFLRPLKLLLVMMHETGHALASLAVGGRVDRVHVALDESGACLSALPAGAWRAIVVYSAGYLGSAVAGALLLIAVFRFGFERAVLVLLATWQVAMALLYAGDAFTLLYCAATAAVLGAAARWLPSGVVRAIVVGIASFSALYALLDLRDDLWNGAVRAQSDAQLLAQITWVPALVWAGIWSLGAVAILAIALAVAAASPRARRRRLESTP